MNEQAKDLIKLMERELNSYNTKFLTISSGKGGVGKTSFAVNFAYILANFFNKKVLLIDADVGMANIHVLLNLKPKKDIRKIIEETDISNLIERKENIDILPGFSGIEEISEIEDYALTRLIQKLSDISNRYDYILIDTSAGIDNRVISFIRAASRSYIIATPEPTSMTDAYALIKSIRKLYGYSKFKLIVNMAESKKEGMATYNRLRESAKRFLDMDLQLAGILPKTKNMTLSIKKKEIFCKIYPDDMYTIELKKISSKELGESVPVESGQSFWGRVLRFLRRG